MGPFLGHTCWGVVFGLLSGAVFGLVFDGKKGPIIGQF